MYGSLSLDHTGCILKIPKTSKITSRSSSITNAFIQAILPTKAWTEAEEAEALSILGMKRPNLFCAYCGAETSEWDHLFPLVRNKRPTGFIHEIRNLVPSCGKCNHSKSGKDWQVWFRSPNGKSPTSRGVLDRDERFTRLENFVSWGSLLPVSFEELIDARELDNYWIVLKRLQDDMISAQRIADRLKPMLQDSVTRRSNSSFGDSF